MLHCSCLHKTQVLGFECRLTPSHALTCAWGFGFSGHATAHRGGFFISESATATASAGCDIGGVQTPHEDAELHGDRPGVSGLCVQPLRTGVLL
jgi:hypothetical protein